MLGAGVTEEAIKGFDCFLVDMGTKTLVLADKAKGGRKIDRCMKNIQKTLPSLPKDETLERLEKSFLELEDEENAETEPA